MVYKITNNGQMSRLSRAVARRDIAWKLCTKLENTEQTHHPLSVTEELTKIMSDIPANKIGGLPGSTIKLSIVWETIGIVAKIASITGLWELPVGSIRSYLPPNDKHWLETFRARWALIRTSPSKNVLDFLELLRQKPLDLNV